MSIDSQAGGQYEEKSRIYKVILMGGKKVLPSAGFELRNTLFVKRSEQNGCELLYSKN
jgi:hypothetical protein